MTTRRTKKQRVSIESDDGVELNPEKDPNWVPEDDHDASNGRRSNDAFDRRRSNDNSNDTSFPEEFDSTEGFTLKTIKTVKQSNHQIWTMFGHLMKNNQNVDKVKDRVYCIKCFEKKKFKR